MTENSTPFYSMTGITKHYLGNVALKDVNLCFERGKISGLIGKNGAGKSTLVNIMYGALEPTEGTITIDGAAVGPLTPSKAQDLGIFLVPQKVQYVHDLTIAQNLFLGRYPRSASGLVDTRTIARKAEEIMARVGLHLSPSLLLGKLSIEQRRLLDVAKALWVYHAKMVILDETTAALGLSSKRILFNILDDAKKDDRSIIFITHRLKEIMEICDDVTVLRDGRCLGTRNIADVGLEILAEMIIGKRQDVQATYSRYGDCRTDRSGDKPFLEVTGLCQPGKFENISFQACKNEIIGIAGMLGSGYNEIIRCLGGLGDGDWRGEVRVDGARISPGSPRNLNRCGLAYLTNNREEEGLFHSMTVEENMFSGTYRRYRNRFGLIDKAKVKADFQDRVGAMDIKLHSPTLLIDSLSGGNKQKILVSRLLNQASDILFFDELAEGIDIEARNKLLRFIDEVARRDRVICLASNVVEDLLTVCDRIIVINHGRVHRTFLRKEFDEQEIYAAIQGL